MKFLNDGAPQPKNYLISTIVSFSLATLLVSFLGHGIVRRVADSVFLKMNIFGGYRAPCVRRIPGGGKCVPPYHSLCLMLVLTHVLSRRIKIPSTPPPVFVTVHGAACHGIGRSTKWF